GAPVASGGRAQPFKAMALGKKLTPRHPQETRYKNRLAELLNTQAIGHANQKNLAEALKAHLRALSLRAAVVRAAPEDPRARSNLASTLNNIGILHAHQGQPADALALYRRGRPPAPRPPPPAP